MKFFQTIHSQQFHALFLFEIFQKGIFFEIKSLKEDHRGQEDREYDGLVNFNLHNDEYLQVGCRHQEQRWR